MNTTHQTSISSSHAAGNTSSAAPPTDAASMMTTRSTSSMSPHEHQHRTRSLSSVRTYPHRNASPSSSQDHHQQRVSTIPTTSGAPTLACTLPDVFVDRLYNRAVLVQRERRADFEEHMAIARRQMEGRPQRCKALTPQIAKQLYSFPVALKQKHLKELREAEDAVAFQGRPTSSMSGGTTAAASSTQQRKRKERVLFAPRQTPLTADEQDTMAQRLCNESLQHHKALQESLEKAAKDLPFQKGLTPVGNIKIQGKTADMEKIVQNKTNERHHKKLDKEEVGTMGQRLCAQSMKHRDETLESLRDRYEFRNRCMTSSPKLTLEQAKASADRLCKGGRN